MFTYYLLFLIAIEGVTSNKYNYLLDVTPTTTIAPVISVIIVGFLFRNFKLIKLLKQSFKPRERKVLE